MIKKKLYLEGLKAQLKAKLMGIESQRVVETCDGTKTKESHYWVLEV
jgi:hypothetical protein